MLIADDMDLFDLEAEMYAAFSDDPPANATECARAMRALAILPTA